MPPSSGGLGTHILDLDIQLRVDLDSFLSGFQQSIWISTIQLSVAGALEIDIVIFLVLTR